MLGALQSHDDQFKGNLSIDKTEEIGQYIERCTVFVIFK